MDDGRQRRIAAEMPTTSLVRVPFFRVKKASPLLPKDAFEGAYGPFQALHIRGFPSSRCMRGTFRSSDIQPLFDALDDEDKRSWCVENEESQSRQNNGDDESPRAPNIFLDIGNRCHRGYCSFLVQHSKIVMNDLLSKSLPLTDLPVETDDESKKGNVMKVKYGPCLWIFFGKNYHEGESQSSKRPVQTLQGRPEHTDSVSHDGTWHYQLSGRKIWRLRPTAELMHRIRSYQQQQEQRKVLSGMKRKASDGVCAFNETSESDINDNSRNEKYVEVNCEEGDILFVNTRLWWHQTLIPPQDAPCISYARDVYLMNSSSTAKPSDSQNAECDESIQGGKKQQSSMTNVDGTYAAEDIEADAILFTEHTMPDCELHRSNDNPNCQVVELEDETTGSSYMAVVSLRDIKAGEFFCILESDEEECNGSGEEVETWEDDDV
ncbi:hypothetical protein ACHAWF_006715 [Thalassiosira exigua]